MSTLRLFFLKKNHPPALFTSQHFKALRFCPLQPLFFPRQPVPTLWVQGTQRKSRSCVGSHRGVTHPFGKPGARALPVPCLQFQLRSHLAHDSMQEYLLGGSSRGTSPRHAFPQDSFSGSAVCQRERGSAGPRCRGRAGSESCPAFSAAEELPGLQEPMACGGAEGWRAQYPVCAAPLQPRAQGERSGREGGTAGAGLEGWGSLSPLFKSTTP